MDGSPVKRPSATLRAVIRLLNGETLEEAAAHEGVAPITVKCELYAIERAQRRAAGLPSDRHVMKRGNRLSARRPGEVYSAYMASFD